MAAGAGRARQGRGHPADDPRLRRGGAPRGCHRRDGPRVRCGARQPRRGPWRRVAGGRVLRPHRRRGGRMNRRIAAQARMELRLLLRNGENLLVTLGIPAGLLMFFSLVDVLDLGEGAVNFLLPGMLTVAVMGSAMVSLAIATGFERSYLVLKRLGATPLTRLELIAAKAAAVLVTLTLQVVVLVTTALLLGWRVPAANGSRAVLLVLVGLVLGTAAFAGIGMAMAGRLRALTTLAV